MVVWRGLMIVALAVWMGMTPCLAQEANPQVAEIRSVLQKHDAALAAHNMDALMATFASGPNTVLMGTGPGEFWVGKEAIIATYQQLFADYDPGSLTTECPWHTGDVQGNMAWLMGSCVFADSLKGKKRQYLLNISLVLEKQEGQWRIRTFHFSNLTGGQ